MWATTFAMHAVRFYLVSCLLCLGACFIAVVIIPWTLIAFRKMDDMVHVDPIRDARMSFASTVGMFDIILSFLSSAPLFLILSSILVATSFPFTSELCWRAFSSVS